MTINGKRTLAKEFAYDNCHKIYLLENEIDRSDAVSCGYQILPIESLKQAFESSCELRFINSWDLKEDFVCQGEDEDVVFED